MIYPRFLGLLVETAILSVYYAVDNSLIGLYISFLIIVLMAVCTFKRTRLQTIYRFVKNNIKAIYDQTLKMINANGG